MSKKIKRARKPRRVRYNQRNVLDPQYVKWRRDVKKRDGHQCQWAGCKKKRGLNIHHIRRWAEFPTLRFVIGNGITLCYEHHKAIQGQEDNYAIMFLKILQMQAQRNFNG